MMRNYDYEVVRVWDDYEERKGDIFIKGYADNYDQKDLRYMLVQWCVAHKMPSGLYCIKIKGYDVECMYPEYFNKR